MGSGARPIGAIAPNNNGEKMLSQMRKTLNSGRTFQRASVGLALGVLAVALAGCSILPHRLRPGSETGREVTNAPGATQPYPNLAGVPDRPKRTESAESRRDIAKGLIADRESARYADQALRGGTEASAPPPPPPVAAVVPPSDPEATGAIETAKPDNAPKKPSFFGRLFHPRSKPAEQAANSGLAPLPAHPTGAVDVLPGTNAK